MSTLLIIDDEAPVRELLQEFFLEEGFGVLTADNGDHAMRIARAQTPDLVLSDINMPGMSGHQLVKLLRDIPALQATPIILITGNADLKDMRKGMDAGADDYMSKPLELSGLLSTVNKHLERSQERRELLRGQLAHQRTSPGSVLPRNLAESLHELIGCASIIQGDIKIMSREEIGEFNDMVLQAAHTLNHRIENVLLYSHIQSGQLTPKPPREVDAAELIRETARLATGRHQQQNRLQIEVTSVPITTTVELVQKAVGAIIDNACLHTPATTPIHITTEVADDHLIVHVDDQGPGLSPADQTALETEDVSKGCGLQLSRRLTGLLGGEWKTFPREPQGLRVQLSIPLHGVTAS